MRSPLPRALFLLGLLLWLGCDESSGPAGVGTGRGGAGAGGTAGSGGTGGTAGTSAGTSGQGGSGGGAGSAGAAGTAGRGGTGGAGGGAGAAGTGGGAGAAGSAGSAGGGAGMGGSAAGRGGTGGTAGSGGAGGASAPFRLDYLATSTTTTAFDVRITSLETPLQNISAIKFRYYFVDDAGDGGPGDVNATIDVARWTILSPSTTMNLRNSGCNAMVTSRAAPAPSYVDVGCSLTASMMKGDALDFSVHFGMASQIPANDYSYQAGAALAANQRMLVTLNGSVVWGSAP